MKYVVAILLAAWGVCASADVYKWTDERGEVHYGESAPNANSEKLITNEQIQQTEQADRARPALPSESASPAPRDEVEDRLSECQRYKNMRKDYLLNVDRSAQQARQQWLYSMGYPWAFGAVNDSTDMSGYTEIEAGVRRYCE